MQCPECKVNNLENAKFCSQCGRALIILCRLCRCKIKADCRFCHECGAPVKETKSRKEPDSYEESERKHVTILFSDLSGFTAMTEQLDPEELRIIMGRIFSKVSSIIKKYDGFIEKFVGDSVMAVFGIPKAHEDDPVRAIKSAVEMHKSVKSMGKWVEKRTGSELTMHTGINTGLVVTGDIDREKGRHGLSGLTINIASRIEGVSKPDEILVSHRTYIQTERHFRFEKQNPVSVKGISDPLDVYKLIFSKDTREPALPHFDLKCEIIGRETETALLINTVRRLATSNKGSIIWIEGEAGIGKSRLIEEVKKQKGDSVYWLEGRALSYSQDVSFWPFLDVLKQFSGITEDDDELKGWQKLKERISSLFPDQVADTLPYIATLLAFEVKGDLSERVAFLNGEALRRQIFKTARQFVSRLAQKHPLVLEFEDFQWTDESTVELFRHLLPLIREHALIMCFISRPEGQEHITDFEEDISAEYRGWYTKIALNPLQQEHSLQMFSRLLKLDEISLQLKSIIDIKSQGNPLFVEELIRTLISRDLAYKDKKTGKWLIRPIKGKVPIPDTLRGLIFASIDRLDEDLKEVLKAASVIGRSFLYRLLKAIQDAREDIDTSLQLLVKDNLIQEKTKFPELEYTFKHDLIKESVYESILLAKRKIIHKKVAEALETIFQEHSEKFCGLLAYHYAQASVWEKAHDYLLKTADQSDRIAADAEALANYKKAVAAYDKKFGNEWDPFQRAVLERKMGESFFRRGDHAQAIEYFHRALALHGKPVPDTRWSIRLSIGRQLIIHLLHRFIYGFFIVRAYGEEDPSVEEQFHIFEMLGWIDFFKNRERLLLHSIQCMNYAERKGYRPGIARGSMALGITCDMFGKFALAEQYHRRVRALIPHISNPIIIGHCYLGVGFHEDFAGHWDRAVQEYCKAAELFWKAGDMRRWGDPVICTAFLLNYKGQFEQSLKLALRLTEVGEQCGDRQLMGWGMQGQGLSNFHTGNVDEALTLFEKAVELLESAADHYSCGITNKDLAKCCLQIGDRERGLKILNATHKRFIELRLTGHFVAFLHNALAEAYLETAEQADGFNNASQARQILMACKAAVKESKRFCWALPEAYRLRGTCFWLRGKRRSALKYWYYSLEKAKHLGAAHEFRMTCSEMVKQTGDDCIDLAGSEEILEAMQNKLDLSNVHKMMQICSE
ncbi:MAG: adenylate/guanylate cyclase domain-containing protein [Bacteroidota bacterium]